MTDQPVDGLLRGLADRPLSEAVAPASVAPAVMAHLQDARRRDRTWLGRLARDLHATFDLESVRAAVRSRPLLSLAVPILLSAAVIGAIAAGAPPRGPGPDRQSSALVPAPSEIAIASPAVEPSASQFRPIDEPPPLPGGGGRLVASSSGGLFVINGDGSERRDLTDGSVADYFPVWSPDGTKIAFFSQDCVVSDRCPDKLVGSSLVVIGADGNDRHVLRNGLENPMGLRWLADGSAVVATYYRPQSDVAQTFGLDGSVGPAKVAPTEPPFVSPDGSQVVRIDDRGQIRIAAADGSSSRILVHVAGGRVSAEVLGWSPDGQSVAYQLDQPFSDQGSQTWVVRRDGTDAHRWSDLPEGGLLVGWSRTGRWMLVRVDKDQVIDHYVVANADGTDPWTVNTSIAMLGWSKDGQRLLGLSKRGTQGDAILGSVVVVDPAGIRPPVEIDGTGLLGFDWRSSD